MNKKIPFVIAVIFAVSLVIFSTPTLANAVNATNTNSNSSSSSNSTNSTNTFTIFENKDFHFRIQHPTNWTWKIKGLPAHEFIKL